MNDNLTLHTDKYQINMMYAHWLQGSANDRAIFEVYFRELPFGNGFAVCAGLERVVRYLQNLRFGEEEIRYLREQEENYDERFLDMLREFTFSGDVYAIPEGTIVFPNEPLIRIEARMSEAHLIETAILNFVNFQTLIATKAARMKLVADQDGLLEFGTRRAHEADAAIWGARAAYIAGFDATSNMRAGMYFGIPSVGTHAHAWVQAHDSEQEAFFKYAKSLPNHVTLLVDTYDTLKSGIPNAIKVAKEMERQGKKMNAIRLDSGDLAFLSKEARRMLDEAGLSYVRIVASNDIDEHIISELKSQGAKIDIWGIGTRLITAADQPSLGGVYKIVARYKNGTLIPVIKVSSNPEKVTNPGSKEVFRLLDPASGKAIADYITLQDDDDVIHHKRIRLFDPLHPYLETYVREYTYQSLLKPIMQNGELIEPLPSLDSIREHHKQQISLFRTEVLRKLNPDVYRVHLSPAAWQLKMDLMKRDYT